MDSSRLYGIDVPARRAQSYCASKEKSRSDHQCFLPYVKSLKPVGRNHMAPQKQNRAAIIMICGERYKLEAGAIGLTPYGFF
jgi:hypothetical protein